MSLVDIPVEGAQVGELHQEFQGNKSSSFGVARSRQQINEEGSSSSNKQSSSNQKASCSQDNQESKNSDLNMLDSMA